MTPRPRQCDVCKEPFIKRRMGQKVCSVECSIVEAVKVRMRKEAKEDREKKKRRADHLEDAQKAVNTFIRARDAALPCISCGKITEAGWNAGHFLSVGSHPELRFEPLNIHKQCIHCNKHKHGNAVLYRLALIEKIGAEAVEWLEGPHDAKKYTVDELKAIKAEYTRKAKELKT